MSISWILFQTVPQMIICIWNKPRKWKDIHRTDWFSDVAQIQGQKVGYHTASSEFPPFSFFFFLFSSNAYLHGGKQKRIKCNEPKSKIAR